MKAADISTEDMLAAIRRDMTERDITIGACTWTLAEREGWPVKVATAKFRKMLRRGLIRGCWCGCRGDWTIIQEKVEGE
jgi:hypothetical protein